MHRDVASSGVGSERSSTCPTGHSARLQKPGDASQVPRLGAATSDPPEHTAPSGHFIHCWRESSTFWTTSCDPLPCASKTAGFKECVPAVPAGSQQKKKRRAKGTADIKGGTWALEALVPGRVGLRSNENEALGAVSEAPVPSRVLPGPDRRN
eukprot:3283777-Rhodomonas_salina.2